MFSYLYVFTIFLVELYAISWSLDFAAHLTQAQYSLMRGYAGVSYGVQEALFAESFNLIFFAASECSPEADTYSWVWRWIEEHCPVEGIQKFNCGCGSENIGTCEAEIYGCSSGHVDVCPYELCRLGAVSFLATWVEYFVYICMATCAVHALKIFLGICLVCYNNSESVTNILRRNGNLNMYPMRDGSNRISR